MKDPRTGRLLATYRVELPGQPILGNGKSDNQNTALPFSRGPILQAIDCNQEGYIEEAFKVPNALREFERGRTLGGKPPAIVGFREHIFSDLGLLGELAASSELCFGTLVQRTLASPLQSRYHYGHPDMLDKIALIAQGGVSKATKDLNLSEDIFGHPQPQPQTSTLTLTLTLTSSPPSTSQRAWTPHCAATPSSTESTSKWARGATRDA